jgi:glutaconate CoA-transferase subunit A
MAQNRFIALHEAAALVPDGATIALGGMTLYRRPVAFVKALLARSPRPIDLTLLSFTAGYESDLLVGAGCVAAVRSCYFGLEAFGLAPMFTVAAQKGHIRIIEETEASLAAGLRAAAARVGFMPSRAWIGTDLPRLRPDVKTILDPYSGQILMAFPALPVAVAVLHGLEADHNGNVRINNNLGVDMELIYAAKTVICTVERVVPRLERSLDGPIIPAPGADWIALAPRGAWPTSCYPDYPLGGGELLTYVEMCSGGQFEDYLQRALAT